jgi:hypothetical protein
MKKIRELLKPFLSIIFGAIVFFTYSSLLYLEDGALALGIIATVIAAYFIVVGILTIVLGDKMSKRCKKLLLIGGLTSFAWYLTASFIVAMVDAELPVNGWIIYILTAVSSFGFGLLLLLAEFANSKFINKLAQLFGAIFVLALLLNVLIKGGTPVALGAIIILEVALYVAYAIMAFEAMGELKVSSSAPKEE